MFESIEIKSKEKIEMIDIMDSIKEAVTKSGVRHGIIVVYVPHSTAGITVNKNYDPVVEEDIMNRMNELIPKDGHYQHIEGNSAAHIKASIFGSSVTLIISNGHIELGMFQSVFFCEFDGPRKRKYFIKIMKDEH
ncbi:secondary thiamine-phosphate synthase enzyme YjbQ [Fusibacter ferrireducens]|uniref:YjbQ family protein n=1 Tax=Fusibacter ferrireducens TaxID=2785058 RepID=A0ABR9ZRQ9_9FIRM|nr:secondary thiamine-phosphate synthase enzyme YjbQ [Fusibacter ferrireducens]MBF4693143.1 YjbQ family protein [Fusibacter ferrireducens]